MKSGIKVIIILLLMAGVWYFLLHRPRSIDTMPATATPSIPSETSSPPAPSLTAPIDTGRLSWYAGVLGRAYGCGLRPEAEMDRVRKWLDDSLSPGSKAHQAHLHDFLEEVKAAADRQRDAKEGTSCSEAESALKTTPWP